MKLALQVLIKIWRSAPRSIRQRLWRTTGHTFYDKIACINLHPPAKVIHDSQLERIVVAGLFRSASGLGEAARSTYRALHAVGLNPLAFDLTDKFTVPDFESEIQFGEVPLNSYGTIILQMNAPETISALRILNLGDEHSWYVIGFWSWELPTFPKGWQNAFRLISEVWTISEFAASALRSHPQSPHVEVIGHCVASPKLDQEAEGKFRKSNDETLFVTFADTLSSLERKNTIGSILAFQMAFGDTPKYRLVVKTRNLQKDKIALRKIAETIDDQKNISVIDRSLSFEEKWSLLRESDVVLSLHRAEGFGLVLAEAMSIGKPVVCTNWSGNMDFTNQQNAVLVKSNLVPCLDPYGVYGPKNSEWAQVDMQHAVYQLQRVARDHEFRSSISIAGKDTIATYATSNAIGRKIKKRFSEIPRVQSASTV